MYLLDTNVISEASRPQPDARVNAWFAAHHISDAYLSVITIAEVEQGILRLEQTKRATELQGFLRELESQFMGRILPVDRMVARSWSAVTASAIRNGTRLPYSDSWLAATALAHNLIVVTRNTKDFKPTGVDILNPWESDV